MDFDDGLLLHMRFSEFFRPHVTIPNVPWRARHRWDLSMKRLVILSLGLAIFGIGDAFLVQSHTGNAPWTVLAQGLSSRLHQSIGVMTALISLVVLLTWIPLREKPGFGTLANIVLIATFIQIGVEIIPVSPTFPLGIGYAICGVLLVGIGSALYISVGLGPGPRDGAMTGIHHKTGIRISRVRMGIELAVLSCGALIGGRVGLGTALFALFIGQSIAISCGLLARLSSSNPEVL